MMPVMSPPLSRALALAILIGVLAVAYLGIVQPIVETRADQREQLDGLETALSRYRRVSQQRPAREAELASLKQRAAAEDGLLRGANETLMAAAVQNRIKELVASAQGEVKSMQILPAQSDGHLRRITVRGQMAMTVEATQRLFHELEGGEPLLFLDNVNIRSMQESRRRRERDRAGDDMLDLRVDVYGYAQPQQ
jgi:general secretion pathway protein M